MGTALAWLNDLMNWFGRFIPRLILIEPTHRGVRFGPTGRAVELMPGLRVYWPITHNVVLVPVVVQTHTLPGILVPHKGSKDDAQTLYPRVNVVASAVQFIITDAVEAATCVLHFQALVMNRAAAVIVDHYNNGAYGWQELALKELNEEMSIYGIDVTRLDVTGEGVGAVMKNLSDWSYSDNTNGTRPL